MIRPHSLSQSVGREISRSNKPTTDAYTHLINIHIKIQYTILHIIAKLCFILWRIRPALLLLDDCMLIEKWTKHCLQTVAILPVYSSGLRIYARDE